jgi:hypothetical protein
MDLGRGALSAQLATTQPQGRGTCPHLMAILDGLPLSNKSSSPATPIAPSVLLLSNWKFLQEYLHFHRIGILDTSKVRVLEASQNRAPQNKQTKMPFFCPCTNG